MILTGLQRLKLIQVIGLRSGNAAVMRQSWKLMDQIDFTPEERTAHPGIDDPSKAKGAEWFRTLPDKEVDIRPVDVRFIKESLEDPQLIGFRPAVDRFWLEPLMASLESSSRDSQAA